MHPAVSHPPSDNTEIKRAAMMLLPFVFGFSTTVVLTIINRLVDAVGVIFGRIPTAKPGDAAK